MAWVLRGRDLLRGTFALADKKMLAESAIVARSLLEAMIKAKWIALDPATHLYRWYLADLNEECRWDNSWRAAATSQSWAHPVGLPDKRMEAARQEVIELEAAGVKPAPPLEQMAVQLGIFDAYPILYRMYCGYAHSSIITVFDPMVLQRDSSATNLVLRSPEPEDLLNRKPYWMPTLIFLSLLELVSEVLALGWGEELSAMKARLHGS